MKVYLPGISLAQANLSLGSGSGDVHTLLPLITLQVSWSPTMTYI